MLAGVFALAAGGDLQAAELTERDYLDDMPVVSSVARLPQPLEDAPASVTVISREMLQRTGVRTLAEAMRLVPGFLVAYFDGGARPYATYHGDSDAFNRHLQVYVDGRSAYSGLLLGSATYGMLGVAIDEIERIEVIRGSNSASQGANAYLGVVNITTRHSADTLGGAVSMAGSLGGTGGISDGGFRFGWGDDRASYRMAVSNSRDSGFANRHDDSDRTTLNLRADWRLSPRDELHFTGGAFAFDWGANVGNPPATPRTERYRSHFAQLRWRRQLDEQSEVRAGGFADEEQYFEFFPGAAKADGRVRRFGLDAQHAFAPLPDVRVLWGGEYRGEEIDSVALYAKSPAQGNHRLNGFGNVEWRLGERWLLNLGASVERHSIVGGHVSPRYGVNFKVAEGHTVRAAQTTAYKVPSQFELKTTWGGLNATGRAQPERIDSTEIGYLGDIRPLRLTVDFRGFVEKSLSFLKFQGTDIVNKDAIRQRGWETQVSWRPAEGTQVIVNHTELRSLPEAGTPVSYQENAPRHFSSLALFQSLPGDVSLALIQSFVEAYSIQTVLSPAYRQTDVRLAKRFRWNGQRAEAALSVLALEGPHFSYTADPRFGSNVDRRAFGTLKFEF